MNNKYYTSGQLMKLAHITRKTIRYYDEHDILKPSYVKENGTRYYTDEDLAKLQQILMLKYLGFSLADIREMTMNNSSRFMSDSLKLQQKLVEDRIEQLQVVSRAIQDTADTLDHDNSVNWSQMLKLIQDMGMESAIKNQYKNASNISARINLHSLYSENKQGWFPWIYEQCDITDKMKILEIGCGDGSLWTISKDKLPAHADITVSDISQGMIRDARRSIGKNDKRFSYEYIDCCDIPFPDNSFDLIIANHVLFYCDNIDEACIEINRVLKPDGRFICGTYGKSHMKEISSLVNEFNKQIVLSAESLYEKFGKENGREILSPYFNTVEWIQYEDSLNVTEAEPLISYIISCHGNQNQYLTDKFTEFRAFIKKKIKNGIHITKDAGIFICKKNNP